MPLAVARHHLAHVSPHLCLAALQLLLEGNPLHEFTASSLSKKHVEERKDISASQTAGVACEQRKTKVYTIGLLNEAGIGGSESNVSQRSILGYSRSVWSAG